MPEFMVVQRCSSRRANVTAIPSDGGTIIHPDFFTGYANQSGQANYTIAAGTRPNWPVAGVDYGVGVLKSKIGSLKDPSNQALLNANASNCTYALFGALSPGKGGSGYLTPGTYTNVSLTGGSGTVPPTATIVVSAGGVVTSVAGGAGTFTSMGVGNLNGDVLTCPDSAIGGRSGGTAFSAIIGGRVSIGASAPANVTFDGWDFSGVTIGKAPVFLLSGPSPTGSLTITNCLFKNDLSTYFQGQLCRYQTGNANIVIRNCTFDGNYQNGFNLPNFLTTLVEATTTGTLLVELSAFLNMPGRGIEPSAGNTTYQFNYIEAMTGGGAHSEFAITSSPQVSLKLLTHGSITGGSSYTPGTYTGVVLTGGSGPTQPTATIVVSAVSFGVTSVTFTNQGAGVAIGDVLTCPASSIGGTGTGWSTTITDTGASVSPADGVSIRLALSSPYLGLTTGQRVVVALVGGVPNALGIWTVKVIDTTHVDIIGPVFGAGAYTNLGTLATVMPVFTTQFNTFLQPAFLPTTAVTAPHSLSELIANIMDVVNVNNNVVVTNGNLGSTINSNTTNATASCAFEIAWSIGYGTVNWLNNFVDTTGCLGLPGQGHICVHTTGDGSAIKASNFGGNTSMLTGNNLTFFTDYGQSGP